jgi:hypothetical protein
MLLSVALQPTPKVTPGPRRGHRPVDRIRVGPQTQFFRWYGRPRARAAPLRAGGACLECGACTVVGTPAIHTAAFRNSAWVPGTPLLSGRANRSGSAEENRPSPAREVEGGDYQGERGEDNRLSHLHRHTGTRRGFGEGPLDNAVPGRVLHDRRPGAVRLQPYASDHVAKGSDRNHDEHGRKHRQGPAAYPPARTTGPCHRPQITPPARIGRGTPLRRRGA